MEYICSCCGSKIENPKKQGENFYNIIWSILSVIFIIVGFINNITVGIVLIYLYIIAANVSREKFVCPVCKSENIIPINTPKGQQLYDRYHKG